MNYYLKFTTEQAMKDSFITLELAEIIDNTFIPKVPTDIIGTIYKPTGVTLTSDGIDYPEMVAIEGWHVNIIADLTEVQEASLPLLPKPLTPYRVWAGEV